MALGSPAYAYIARGWLGVALYGAVTPCAGLWVATGGYALGHALPLLLSLLGGLWVSLWARLGHSGSLRDTLMDTTGILLGNCTVLYGYCMDY